MQNLMHFYYKYNDNNIWNTIIINNMYVKYICNIHQNYNKLNFSQINFLTKI